MGTVINPTGVSTDGIVITVSAPPVSPDSPGVIGQFAWDEEFIYCYTANGKWKRTGWSDAW